MARVALNGLGRIGRAVLKIAGGTPGLEVVGLNDLLPAEEVVYLLKFDSVYGRYEKPVEADGGDLLIDGRRVRLFARKEPSRLPWKDLGVDMVFECTGRFKDAHGMSAHLRAGARKVLLSTQATDEAVPTVIYGVNNPPDDADLVSCASCTTNCITPVVEVMGRRIGIRKVALTTLHACTASQNIVDRPAAGMRRDPVGTVNRKGGSLSLRVHPFVEGEARAAWLPEGATRAPLIDAIAIRAPVPTGSICDMVFVTERETSVEEVNALFREESRTERYRDVLGTSDEKILSTDIIKDTRASVVDLKMTQVIDGDLVKVLSWYDNEWGYASQMVRVAAQIARM